MHTYDKQYRFLTWSFGISKNESLTYINETKKMPMNTVEDIFAYLENKSIDNIDRADQGVSCHMPAFFRGQCF